MSEDFKSASQNRTIARPTLADLITAAKRDVMLSLNCHAIGTIQSFDAETQSAEVTINYRKSILAKDENTQVYRTVLQEYPLMVDVPVVCLTGGDGSLTFPIANGDTCLILFNDRDLDNWITSGQADGPVATTRLHSFSDGIALVGLRPFSNPLADYDPDRVVLKKGTTAVKLGDKVSIENAAGTLLSVLEGLIDVLKTGFNSPTPSPGTPLSASAVTALEAYKATVEDLLE